MQVTADALHEEGQERGGGVGDALVVDVVDQSCSVCEVRRQIITATLRLQTYLRLGLGAHAGEQALQLVLGE